MSLRRVFLCTVCVLMLSACGRHVERSAAVDPALVDRAAASDAASAVPPHPAATADDAPLPDDPMSNAAPIPVADETSTWTSTAGTVVEAAPEAETPYLLDSGDRVRVFVYGQPNLSRVYPVDGAGFIAMPLIGSIKARGGTTYELSEAVAAELRIKYVRDPEVAVEMAAYRPFYILGEVRNAGQFPYVSGMTVQTAVAIAGGWTPRANTRSIDVTRTMQGERVTMSVPPDYEVMPGDTISVAERFF